jgi:CHAT domain-containing protein
VLSLLHFGLLAANQLQRDPSSGDPLAAAIAKGKELRHAGKLTEALLEYSRALTLARQDHNVAQTIRILMLIASADTMSFQYQGALSAAKEAFELARAAGNNQLAGGASGAVSSIYFSLGDFQTAEVEGRRAIELLRLAPPNEPNTRQFMVRALQLVATLCSMQGRASESENLFQQAIPIAQQLNDRPLEASLWDFRGVVLLRDNQLSAAERSLQTALAIRESLHDNDTLPYSKEHLAELELKRESPNYAYALKMADEALSSRSPFFIESPQYYPLHIRAQILLRSGERPKALVEFRHAVSAAETWRQGALPGDTTNTQTVVLLHEVYQDFAQLAAQISLETNNAALRDEALEVLASNRAASLREQLKRVLATDAKIPDSYFEKLSALQAAQARVTLGKNNKTDQMELARLRTDIGEFENKLAVQNGKNYFSNEKNLRKNSLRDIRKRLGRDELLLSLSLGETKSYLWAVTGDQVNLYQIEGRAQLENEAAQLTQTVRAGKTINMNEVGQSFSQSLFGALPQRLLNKPSWIVVADGALLNGVPFAVLPEPPHYGTGRLLAEKHSVRLLPSELLLLSPSAKPPLPRFVGVADPIYNRADSRLKHEQGWDTAPVEASSVTLARLAGSSQEVRSSAKESGLPDQQILDGPQASAQNLRPALASPPELLHFAVHVVSPPNRPQEAALALSLNKDGVPELLTPEAIATFRLPGTLVVLSGCSSGQGKTFPSAGLLGLSRAWLLAGADAVIASSWPTPDDSGRFFSLFYSHLRAATIGTLSQRASLALAQTQVELQHGSGYTSSPSYWGAYSIISKE